MLECKKIDEIWSNVAWEGKDSGKAKIWYFACNTIYLCLCSCSCYASRCILLPIYDITYLHISPMLKTTMMSSQSRIWDPRKRLIISHACKFRADTGLHTRYEKKTPSRAAYMQRRMFRERNIRKGVKEGITAFRHHSFRVFVYIIYLFSKCDSPLFCFVSFQRVSRISRRGNVGSLWRKEMRIKIRGVIGLHLHYRFLILPVVCWWRMEKWKVCILRPHQSHRFWSSI